jgi:hypothetical protein
MDSLTSRSILLVHTLTASVLGVLGAALHYRNSADPANQVELRYKLVNLLVWMALVAVAIATLQWFKWPVEVSLAVLIAFVGRLVSSLVLPFIKPASM